MTKRSPEELAREIIFNMVPKEVAYRYHFAFDAVEAMLCRAIEAERQRTMPSREEFKNWMHT